MCRHQHTSIYPVPPWWAWLEVHRTRTETDSWNTSVRHMERDLEVLSVTVSAFEKAERQVLV